MNNNILKGLKIRGMPIYNREGKVFYYEYLSSKKGVSIDIFMREIDSKGKKSELFKKVFSLALIDLEKNEEKNVSINIGTKELFDEELIKYINNNNLYSKRIIIEILEESFEGKDENILKNIKSLKKSGYKIAIDDFGKKYSNLDRVNQLISNNTLDLLKIDGELLEKLFNNKASVAPFKKYLEKLQEKGILIVAEYVINEEKYNFSKDILGVDEFQGEYFEKIDKK